jgi:hypothetical protein
MSDRPVFAQRHRATYILEMGVWRAACRACGYTTTDPNRRRAASVFRNHIRDSALDTNLDPSAELDLPTTPADEEGLGAQRDTVDLTS